MLRAFSQDPFTTNKGQYAVIIWARTVVIAFKPRDATEFDRAEVKGGPDIGDNLVAAGRTIGLSDRDIAIIAGDLSVALPDSFVHIHLREPRSMANRFDEPVPV